MDACIICHLSACTVNYTSNYTVNTWMRHDAYAWTLRILIGQLDSTAAIGLNGRNWTQRPQLDSTAAIGLNGRNWTQLPIGRNNRPNPMGLNRR